jgi:hypothetical protein
MNIKYRRDLWQVVPAVGDAVEIGVAEGYFSTDILAWPIRFPRVYMVDRWESVTTQKGDASNPQRWHDKNLADAQARVAQYGERAVFLRGGSVAMADQVPDGSLALVYIDGDHSYEGCLRDIVAWFPKLGPGAVMAFHDYENPVYGVKRAVTYFVESHQLPIRLLPEDKMEDAGAYFIL